ncbi:hypothetical protein O181_019165 [Austropuccinia psidii MF-1]|uniref:Reverse transcriptase Ty1/copia-type domain-containing protein n=1 Tax=Austropuccinia psidii MF-1 TaxID=1389203 RepID=A0A9Q3CA29_9BASI|nr:hypothetical protein [Austropuccinia psidii MF-1]
MVKLKDTLSRELKLKCDIGIHSIVGIEVRRVGDKFELFQPALIKKLCNLNPRKITAGQPFPLMDLLSENSVKINKAYMSCRGMLLYVAQATQPYIMFLVNYLARFLINTTPKNWEELDHLISYMRGTKNKALLIESEGKEEMLKVYVDANWGGEGSRSQHGFIGFYMGSPVAWNSKRQTCVASLTCQAE